jgi:hypothetical protein
MADERHPSPAEDAGRLYEEAESRTARAFETLVSRDSFGELLARVTENTVALTKIGSDILDLTLRNLRLAGRQDVTRLARQLGRTEDKLERLLQEVERLHDRADALERPARARGNRRSTSASGGEEITSANGGDGGGTGQSSRRTGAGRRGGSS